MEWDESLLQPKGLKKQISAFDPENEKMYFEWMAVWDWDWECIEGKSIPDIQQAFNDHLNLRRFQTTRTVCSKRKYTRRFSFDPTLSDIHISCLGEHVCIVAYTYIHST